MAAVREISYEPVTRVAGGLGLHVKADLANRKVLDAYAFGTIFRGYEVILKGRDPRDAVFISSRVCGACGAVHAPCSAKALDMAYGVSPPPLAIGVRDLGDAAEMIHDHSLILFALGGPDYSRLMVEATNPKLWAAATKSKATYSDVHGFSTVAEIMEAMNPLSGKLYVEALHMSRLAREMLSLVYGKYPHPSTIVPGGISVSFSVTTVTEYLTRLLKLSDYAKRLVRIFDDLTEFFYSMDPAYERIGTRPANLICGGHYDNPEAYDGKYENMDSWGEKRFVTPGLVLDGELKTTKLTEINLGIEEFVEHSFYEEWDGKLVEKDPLGNPLSPNHPWNRVTKPKPTGKDWKEKYSWVAAPRWNKHVVETGPIARLWITSAAGKIPDTFVKATKGGISIVLPKHFTPEMQIEWKIPKVINALERNRARAYFTAYSVAVAYTVILKALELVKAGKAELWRKYAVPTDRRIGVGFHEAPRGILTHHAVIEKGKIENYQIVTPSTWNASPRDAAGKPGPYEESVLNTPILEEFIAPEKFQGIDILRTIRSFDPCMPCGVQIYTGHGIVKKEVSSCCS